MKKTILLVDDESVVAKVTQQLLERSGYGVRPFTDSQLALQAFREDPEAFDLVITDMKMPKLDGMQLSRALLAARPDIPIILCTGFSESITAEKALALGIREFLLKPIRLKDITLAIERAFNRPAVSRPNGNGPTSAVRENPDTP